MRRNHDSSPVAPQSRRPRPSRAAAWCLPALAACALLGTPTPGHAQTSGPIQLPSSGEDRTVDVAYDAGQDVFLAIWEGGQQSVWPVSFSTQGHFLSGTGAPVGSRIFIEVDQFVWSHRPRVANVASRGAFVVVWEQDADLAPTSLVARTVDATTGALSPVLTIANGIGRPGGGDLRPDIGGASTATDDGSLVVYLDPSQGTVELVQLVVAPGGMLSVGARRTLASLDPTSLASSTVSIAQSGGASGRYLVTWDVRAGAQSDIQGAVVDANLNLLDSGPIASSGQSERRATVDGNGDQWLIAFELDDGTGSTDIASLGIFWSPRYSTAYPGSVGLVSSGTGAETEPHVAWTGDSYAVSYRSGGAGHLATVDPYTGTPCGAGSTLTGTAGSAILLASKESGGVGAGEKTVAIHIDGFVQVQSHDPVDGEHADLGGGCGAGGRADASCALIGNSAFRLRLREAQPNAPSFLLIGGAASPAPCGPCILVPAVVIALPAGNTDVLGNLELGAPIPGDPILIGGTLVFQWLQPGTGCLGLDFSSGHYAQIQ